MGWCSQRCGDQLQLLPMSDGGDGFGEVIGSLTGGVTQTVLTCDAAHRRCVARWWWHDRTRTAILETAGVVGLAMLPAGKFHPFDLDTFGVGKLLRAAFDKGARRVLVGLGGSATNDGGFGMARALGWQFRTREGKTVESWTELTSAVELRRPVNLPRSVDIVVAVDVQNPLLGSRGATRVYGPQKGLKSADFALAEQCLRRLASLVHAAQGRDLARSAGAGAAGGLGFGFAAFLNGRLRPGFALFAREAHLDQHLRQADLVITGEGAIDRSTFMGKGAGQIARRCRQLRIPCIGLAGVITPPDLAKRSFCEIGALAELTSLERAKCNAAGWLERLAAKLASRWECSDQRRTGN